MWPFKKKSKEIKQIQEEKCGYNLSIIPDAVYEETTFHYSYSQNKIDISSFIVLYSAITKKLLNKKGFPINNSNELIQERIALLHSEVSELVDAEKKGKDIKEKQDELADIIIRLMNIPLMFEDILNHFKVCSESENDNKYLCKVTVDKKITAAEFNMMINEGIDYVYENSKYLKLTIINKLHRSITRLESHLINLKESQFEEHHLYFSVNSIIDIILYCYLYIEISPEIHGNLHEFVDSKMKENFKRPYRFNTSNNF